jgi:putative membrane protein
MPTLTTQPTPSPIPPGKATFAAVNSGLNASATILLIAALVAIKRRKFYAHGTLMICALTMSAIFLVCYLVSKFLFGEVTTQAVTGGHAPKWAVTLYLIVLIPHLIAAIGMLPLIFLAVWHAAHRRWDKHIRIAKPTWFIWFYVSVTGVLVYWMLYHWLPGYSAAV